MRPDASPCRYAQVLVAERLVVACWDVGRKAETMVVEQVEREDIDLLQFCLVADMPLVLALFALVGD